MSKKSDDMFGGVDPDAAYKVALTRPIKVGRTWARPGTDVTLKGRIVLEHKDAISELSPDAA